MIKKNKRDPIKELEKEYLKRGYRMPRLIVDEVIQKKGLSYSDISTSLGIAHPSNVARIKKSQTLGFEMLLKLALILDVPVCDLIEDRKKKR